MDFGVHMIHMCFWSAYDTQSLLVVEKNGGNQPPKLINTTKVIKSTFEFHNLHFDLNKFINNCLQFNSHLFV